MIAIPQIITGKRLTADGIKYIYDQAVAGNLGENVMGRDCTCGANEHKLMNEAFDLLGDKDHFCRQIFVSDAAGKYRSPDMLPSKDNLLFIVVDFNTTSNKATYGGHHFVLFNSIGELIYDPAGGTVHSWLNMNRWLVYKVYSRSAQDRAVTGKTQEQVTKKPPAPPVKPTPEPIKASAPAAKTQQAAKPVQKQTQAPAAKPSSKPTQQATPTKTEQKPAQQSTKKKQSSQEFFSKMSFVDLMTYRNYMESYNKLKNASPDELANSQYKINGSDWMSGEEYLQVIKSELKRLNKKYGYEG